MINIAGMKLTQDQIQELYIFTRKHFVEHYDLQTELVDHLSNGIEEQWQKNQHLTFKEALNREFKKFGVFGFHDVIAEKTKAMNKRYWKILLRFLKEWFRVPKIILTLLIFTSFTVLLQYEYAGYFLMIILSLLFLFDLFKMYQSKKSRELKKKNEEKIFMLEAMINGARYGNSSLVFVNVFNLINLTDTSFGALQMHWVVIIAAIATLLCISFYIVNYVIPPKAQELLEETYPEYKFAKSL